MRLVCLPGRLISLCMCVVLLLLVKCGCALVTGCALTVSLVIWIRCLGESDSIVWALLWKELVKGVGPVWCKVVQSRVGL